MVGVLAIAIVMGGTLVAVAGQSETVDADRQQSWSAWFLGSASANTLQWPEGICGELVDGTFFLAPGITGPEVERTCEIPSGVELLITNIGGFSNSPTDGNKDVKLFSAAMGYFQGVVPKSVKAFVDGALVPKSPATCIDPFDAVIEPGSFLDEVDDQVTGDTSRVALCGWFYVLGPLSAGAHTLSFQGKFKGDDGVTTLTLHVTAV
jgi:hypothetical protein